MTAPWPPVGPQRAIETRTWPSGETPQRAANGNDPGRHNEERERTRLIAMRLGGR